MNYEEKYKEALETIHEILNSGSDSIKMSRLKLRLQSVFPEIKEDEDERIRKDLIEFVKQYGDNFYGQISKASAIPWLEKQRDDDSMSPKEIAKSIGKSLTLSLINYLDNNRYDGAMDLEKSIIDYEWGKVYRYMRKKLEKQDVQKETNLIEILKHYPRETELYSPLYGKLYLAEVDEKNEIIICYKHCLAEGCTRAILEQEDTVSFYSDGTTGLPDFNVSKDCMLFLYNITKQGVQKPVNKIKPKFNVRDWIVYETEEWKEVLQIETLEFGCYTFTNGSSSSFAEEQNMRLWNIQDAKDGDVIAFYYEHKGNKIEQVGIIKKYVGSHGGCSNSFNIYVGLNWENNLQIGEYMGSPDIQPATKEQRELLFSKMKEAGYEWSADDKKMKITDWSKHVKSSITEQADNENL